MPEVDVFTDTTVCVDSVHLICNDMRLLEICELDLSGTGQGQMTGCYEVG